MEMRESRSVNNWRTDNSMRNLGEGIRILRGSEIGYWSHFNLQLKKKNQTRKTLAGIQNTDTILEKMVTDGEWILHIHMKRYTVELVLCIFNINN